MNSPDTPDSTGRDTARLAEHFFRHESGRLVSTLTRVLGPQRLDLVEDVVQAAFLQALGSWGTRGVPDEPGAWLFQVARNLAIDALRRQRRHAARVASNSMSAGLAAASEMARLEAAQEIADDQLRMLTLCCHPALPPESQVALSLKMLSGFSAAEIARALLTSEANAEKRLVRAKARLRTESFCELSQDALLQRLPGVLNVIYLLFNEGYSSTQADRLVRQELCGEALRLGAIITDDVHCRTPEACALMALMCFHGARLNVRESDDGHILLLSSQPRDAWNADMIAQGVAWLGQSARGDLLTPWHLEAGIAAEHCAARTFDDTNWARVLELYDLLVTLEPSGVHRLNRAVAVAYAVSPQAALAALAEVKPEEIPRDYHLWDAVMAELYRRSGDNDNARLHLRRALAAVRTTSERQLLQERLRALEE